MDGVGVEEGLPVRGVEGKVLDQYLHDDVVRVQGVPNSGLSEYIVCYDELL